MPAAVAVFDTSYRASDNRTRCASANTPPAEERPPTGQARHHSIVGFAPIGHPLRFEPRHAGRSEVEMNEPLRRQRTTPPLARAPTYTTSHISKRSASESTFANATSTSPTDANRSPKRSNATADADHSTVGESAAVACRARDGEAGGADRGDGIPAGRIRYREGSGGAIHSPSLAAPQRPVCGGQLRRVAGAPARIRAVRLRARCIYRRPPIQGGAD